MPRKNPFIAFGHGLIADTAGKVLTLGLDAALKPNEVMGAQKAFEDYSVIIPEPGALMDAYQQRLLTEHAYRYFMGRHGIQALPLENPDPENAGDAVMDLNSVAWRAVERSSRAMPDIMLALKADLSGLLGKGTREELFERYRLDLQWWQKCWPMLYEAPGIEDANDLHIRGIIDDATWRKMLWRNGALPDEWQAALQGQLLIPTPNELQVMRNRGMIDDADFTRFMERSGWGTELWRRNFLELRKVIPPVGDLILFELKEAFLPVLANQLGLYDEFPGLALPWVQKQGLVDGPGFQIHSDGADKPAHWLDMYWASHWQAPAAGQIMEFYQRHRVGRVERYRAQFPDIRPFDLTEAKRWLRYANVPPGIRSNFLAAAYRVLPMRTVQQGLRYGTIQRADAVEDFQDQGYAPVDAERMADIAEERNRQAEDAPRQSLVKRALGAALKEILASYEAGVLDREDARGQAFVILRSQDATEAYLNLSDAKLNRELMQAALAAIRRDYLNGTLAPAELLAGLIQSGVTAQRADRLVRLWGFQRSHSRKAASTAQVLKWVAEGSLTPDDGRRRLTNLGWTEPDLTIQLSESQQKMAAAHAKQRAADDKSALGRAKALAQVQKDLQRQHKEVEAKIRKAAPVASLKKWLKLGLINEELFRRRLRQMGYPRGTIDLLFKEVESGVNKSKTGKAPRGKKQAKADIPPPANV